MKKILLIGCGHMGNALFVKWLSSNQYKLTVVDPIKYSSLKNKYNKNKRVHILKTISDVESISKFDFIILATKPIDLNNALRELLKTNINYQTTLVSIVAGKKIKMFQKKLNKKKNIFRVMPNMPAFIGESMNCITSSTNSSFVKRKEVNKLFSYTGKNIFLDNENQIDMATAVSGSGPGFIYNIIDAMQKAAEKIGFKKNVAKTLVEETFKGSINLMLNEKITPEKLVKTVATKGGTTEAGIKVMRKNRIHEIFVEILKASYEKAKEQGK